MTPFSLYIHIPFCKNAKCIYCDFVSFCGSESKIDDYISVLNAELNIRAKEFEGKTLKTIFIGGGTPSTLSSSQMSRLFEIIRGHFSLENCTEITIECNPESITEEKLKTYKTLGINRISIGAQTMNDSVLQTIHRQHSAQTFKKSLSLAKKYFSNINVDMMLGLPHQTLKDAVEMANFLTQSGISHISAYILMLEEGTPLFKMVSEGTLSLPSEEETLEMFDRVAEILQKEGFERYEISNFAKKGYESLHNKNYWTRGEYIGIGTSAHSFCDGTRSANTSSLDEYINTLKKDNLPLAFAEKLSKREEEEEFVMLSLRLSTGVDINEYNTLYNRNILKDKASQISLLCSQNLVKIANNHIMLTSLGTHVLNKITLELL